MFARTILVLVMSLGAMAVVAGCGPFDDAKDKVVKNAQGELYRQCVERARGIEDREDRLSALKACKSINRANADSVREEAARRCIKRALEIEDPALRRRAQARCTAIRNAGR